MHLEIPGQLVLLAGLESRKYGVPILQRDVSLVNESFSKGKRALAAPSNRMERIWKTLALLGLVSDEPVRSERVSCP